MLRMSWQMKVWLHNVASTVEKDRKGGFQIQNDANSRKRRQTSPNPLWHGGGNVMVQISMAGGTAGLGASTSSTSKVDVLQLEIRHENVSCPMRSLVFTSLCQQWALQ